MPLLPCLSSLVIVLIIPPMGGHRKARSLGPGFLTDSNALTAMELNMKNVVFNKSIMDEVFDLEILPDFEILLPQGAKLVPYE